MNLLWELMTAGLRGAEPEASKHEGGHSQTFLRLPGDCRCIALRKDGQRCRGRIRGASDYCLFHDPTITPEQRRARAARGAQTRRRVHLPKGYPRRLDSAEAVERALNRLYAELRTAQVDLATGRTLFEILCELGRLHGGSAWAPGRDRHGGKQASPRFPQRVIAQA